MRATVSHWLPIITRCPVNGLPDLLCATIHIDGPAPEIYGLRKFLFRSFFLRKIYMEGVLEIIATRARSIPGAKKVTLTLLGGKFSAEIDL